MSYITNSLFQIFAHSQAEKDVWLVKLRETIERVCNASGLNTAMSLSGLSLLQSLTLPYPAGVWSKGGHSSEGPSGLGT